jgi:ATP adenylyltransferase
LTVDKLPPESAPPHPSHALLWAPWRLAYVTGDAGPSQPAADAQWLPGADQACFLCRAAAETHDRQNLLVARGPLGLTMLNRFPYNNGHLLVAPLRHEGQLENLSADEHLEIAQTLAQMVLLLRRLLRAEGFNIGLNLGRPAGAGLPGHLHWHVVPRWQGDTNFMPAVAGTRVIPQSLDALWELLTEGLGS